MFTSVLNKRFVGTATRRLRFGSSLSTVLVAGAALLGPAGSVDAAQFPATPMNEPAMPSAGVFQITVTDQNMKDLMNAGGLSGYQYVGWNPTAFTVTSPVMYDPDTHISVSGVHQREVSGVPPYAFTWPVQVGDTTGTLGQDYDEIGDPANPPHQYYNDYVYPAPLSDGFDFTAIYAAGQGPNEVLTEIKDFNLYPLGSCPANSNGCPCPQLPPADSWSDLGPTFPLVRAGYFNNYNGSSGVIGNYLKHSIGMVQSKTIPAPNPGNPDNTDFPADSFFDIYVEITLPPVPGSVSADAFPAIGAVLTNTLPLIITATDLAGFPPSVVYTHTGAPDNQFAVALKFRDDGNFKTGISGPRYYYAGDTFGYVLLAGHGLLEPCPGQTNGCSNLTNFVNAVYGPPEQLGPRAVVGRDFSNALFPVALSLYASVPGTNYSRGSADAIHFTNGPTDLRARSFRVSNFLTQVPLPPANSSLIYTSTNAAVSFEISTDGTNFISATGVATNLQVLIINTNPPVGNTTVYYTELLALDVWGSSGIGQFALRESPTKASTGKHIVQEDGGGHFTIGGYLNASLAYSFNGGITFKEALRSIRLDQQVISTQHGTPVPLAIVRNGSSVILSWPDSTFRLQATVSLSSPSWVDIPGASPITVTISGPYRFFRLISP